MPTTLYHSIATKVSNYWMCRQHKGGMVVMKKLLKAKEFIEAIFMLQQQDC